MAARFCKLLKTGPIVQTPSKSPWRSLSLYMHEVSCRSSLYLLDISAESGLHWLDESEFRSEETFGKMACEARLNAFSSNVFARWRVVGRLFQSWTRTLSP